ncbi:hypothetical protein DPM19_16010 [Actinomadura craniellae]|uniref:Uncharacterized protein n=2 Tax=Actinomadura craniellae TaxID=2231787 RepID=A0A365H5Z3_9ACTN|nr:hypothetical protein DPM19_16010 [Actinomadura craniellae]
MPDPGVLARSGADPAALTRAAASRHLLVTRSGPAGGAAHLIVARDDAAALAAATGGVLLDPALARFAEIPARVRPAIPLRAGSAAPAAVRAFVPGEWIRIMGTPAADGLALTTLGLTRLGAPELRVAGLPPYLGQAWARLLHTLAGLLVPALWRDPAALPGEFVLDGEPVGLRYADGALTPVPPPGFTGAEQSWRTHLATALFPAARS